MFVARGEASAREEAAELENLRNHVHAAAAAAAGGGAGGVGGCAYHVDCRIDFV